MIPAASPASRHARNALPACVAGLLAAALLATCSTAQAQVVVLGHPDSGDYVIVENRQAARMRARERADGKGRDGGWTLLLASTAPGHGAMFCFRPKGGDVRYFIAEAQPTGREAIIMARAQAADAARGTGKTVYICGTWHNRNTHPLDPAPTP